MLILLCEKYARRQFGFLIIQPNRLSSLCKDNKIYFHMTLEKLKRAKTAPGEDITP